MRALEEEAINLEEFLESMNSLVKAGFRLREEIYLEAIAKARKIVTRQH